MIGWNILWLLLAYAGIAAGSMQQYSFGWKEIQRTTPSDMMGVQKANDGRKDPETSLTAIITLETSARHHPSYNSQVIAQQSSAGVAVGQASSVNIVWRASARVWHQAYEPRPEVPVDEWPMIVLR